MSKKLSIDDVKNYCKDNGFIFQSSEIYNGFSGFFDYGPNGCRLKNKLKDLYKNYFIRQRDDIYEIDGSIISNPKVWEVSGHTKNFSDLILTTKKSKTKLRADHFIEDKLNISADGISATKINEIIKSHNLKFKNENGDEEEFEEVKPFNLMFNTKVGAKEDTSNISYLRPETCQTIFVNFKQVQKSQRAKLPFGICQIGKAFRNEISPRDFIFRCREFEQIELEYFFDKNEDPILEEKILNYEIDFLSSICQEDETNKVQKVKIKDLNCNNFHKYWIYNLMIFLNEEVGLKKQNLRIREHMKKELSHYSSATFDIDFNFPFGFKELVGIANRGDYDLSQHQNASNQDMTILNNKTNEKVLANVIEPSIGLERLFFALIYDSYVLENDEIKIKLNQNISPFDLAIFPISKDEKLTNFSKNIKKQLSKKGLDIYYDESGNSIKRISKVNKIGVKYCIIIDFDSLENSLVVLRNRDDDKKIRIKIDEILNYLK